MYERECWESRSLGCEMTTPYSATPANGFPSPRLSDAPPSMLPTLISLRKVCATLRKRHPSRYVGCVTDFQLLSAVSSTATEPPPATGRDAMRKVGRQIRAATLLPWMQAYAEWLILECLEPPKRSLRTRTARGLARAPVSDRHLYELEARKDFNDYCNALRAGPLEQARARFANAMPAYVQAHFDALQLASTASDYKAMAQIAEPVLDRVYPKKADAIIATQIVVQLTPDQAHGVSPAYVAPLMAVTEATPEPATDDRPGVPATGFHS